MKLWLLTYDCGDYYCDREHFAGVFTTEELARAAIEPHGVAYRALYRYGGSHLEYEVCAVTVDEVEKP